MRALVILAHGSRRTEAHDHIERIAAAVRARAPELAVEVAYLELAEPSLEQTITRLAARGASPIAIHPLLLAPGRHLLEDLPRRIRAAGAAAPGVELRLLEPLGSRPELADLILATLE